MSDSVCVVVTCYNLEKYIDLAIQSVLDQDYGDSVEVVVVDDCSTDRSAEIIKSYSDIRYVRSEKNLGVLLATVLGLESTSGELVFFLDGDDIWEPLKLSAVVERFRAEPRLALVTHDLKYIDRTGRVLSRKSRPEDVMASVAASNQDAVIRDGILLHRDYVWLGSAYAIRRTLSNVTKFCAFAKALPDPFNTYQDWPLAFWIACQPGVGVGYVALKLFRYRLHEANHSGDARSADRAVRNVRRTYNTMRAIEDMAIASRSAETVRRSTQRKLRYYKCILDLYEGRRLPALQGLLASLPYPLFSTESSLKEFARFAGVQLLGLRRFISVVTCLKGRGNAPL